MSIIYQERLSESPYIETVMCGETISDGSTIRPAENGWHLVFVQSVSGLHPLVVGPCSRAGTASWEANSKILWVKFKLGVFMPHLPTRKFVDTEMILSNAANESFWLHSSTWQYPTYENVESLIDRLVHQEVLVFDPVVRAALHHQLPETPVRTVRHRFLQATGLNQSHIRQFERAQHAAKLLRDGTSIPDTMYELGYFDQPHLTRALKQFIGQTPLQWMNNPPTETIRLNSEA